MRRASCLGFVAVLGISVTTTARAEQGSLVVRDGDVFTIDLASTSPCFEIPDALRERAPCPDVVRSQESAASEGAVARGRLALEEHGPPASFSVFRIPNPNDFFDAWSFEKLDAAVQRGLQRGSLDAGTVRPGRARIVYVANLPVMRTTANIDGLPPAEAREMEYESIAAFFAEGSVYVLMVGGSTHDAAAIDKVVDQLTSTVHLGRPAREKARKQETLASWGGRFLFYVFVALVGIVAYVRDRRRRAILAEDTKTARELSPRRKKKRRKRGPDL